MSKDYPNRDVWLAKRCTPRGRDYGVLVRAVPAGGKTKDPGSTHSQRRRRGPLTPATGPGSINAESEVGRLIEAGEAAEAAAYIARHNSIRGCPKMTRFADWLALYKAGDSRARGFAA